LLVTNEKNMITRKHTAALCHTLAESVAYKIQRA